MADNTKIEWADATFNPWIGCTKVSAACDHCYAEKWDARWGHSWGPHIRRRTSSANWRKPLAWDRAAAKAGSRIRVFCASLSDVFDNDRSITSGWRGDLWHLIHRTPHLDWMLLTKRPQNIARYLRPEEYGNLPAWGDGWPNVWLGTTVENQTEAERRIPHLLAVPAAVRFISAEPLLGPVDLTRVQHPKYGQVDALTGYLGTGLYGDYGPRLSWVIAGGESGPGARPCHPDWARSLRDQCQAAGVAFNWKQWGEWAPVTIDEDQDDGTIGPAYPMRDCTADWSAHHGQHECLFWQGDDLVHWPYITEFPAIGVRRVGKSRAGRLLDGREWNEVPG